uniref:Putative cytochrome P450 hydroxylase n=1 Tax=uncultured bacterium esnapd15 TaxID=1366595 RepID=S5TN12_9BACT|nr:putative cytochrome P450 hydroxylase [uncultured bacterium esnapd15]
MSGDDSPPIHIRRQGFDPADDLRAAGKLTRISIGSGAEATSTWLAAGHAVVRQVLGDHKRFSTRRRFDPRDEIGGQGRFRPRELVGNLMDYDPPEHTRLRQLLTPGFTQRRMRLLGPRIEEIVAERLDAVEQAGPPADLIELFADKVPGAVLCELIGVPRDDRDMFLQLCHRHLDPALSARKRASAGEAFSRYLRAMVTRERKDPGESFIGSIVAEHGDTITDDELRGVCVNMVLAGDDNVSGMLGLGVLALLRHPEQIAAVRGDDRVGEPGGGGADPVPDGPVRTHAADRPGGRHGRGPGDQGGGDRPLLAPHGQPRPRPAAGCRPARRHARTRAARGVRARRASLPGIGPGPPRTADGLHRPVAAFPRAEAGGSRPGNDVPHQHSGVRINQLDGGVVTARLHSIGRLEQRNKMLDDESTRRGRSSTEYVRRYFAGIAADSDSWPSGDSR